MRKIKKGDEVIVSCGKDKGVSGKVLEVLGERAKVENVNMVRKAVRPNPNTGDSGGIVDREMPIHLSNLRLLNPATGKGDRVGFKIRDDGKKVRYFKSDGETVDADAHPGRK